MVAPPDVYISGHLNNFKVQSVSIYKVLIDTFADCSPNRVPLLLAQVLFVSAEAPGLSDQASPSKLKVHCTSLLKLQSSVRLQLEVFSFHIF